MYDNVGERPDTKGQKYCLVLSSSRDLMLDDLVIALDTETELHHWKDKITDEIQVCIGTEHSLLCFLSLHIHSQSLHTSSHYEHKVLQTKEVVDTEFTS